MATGKITRRLGILAVAAIAGSLPTGCARIQRWAYPPPDNVAADYAANESAYLPEEISADLAGGEHLFGQKDYSSSGHLFHRVAEDDRSTPTVAEKARFFEAECQRLDGDYPDAMRTYNRLLQDFPSGSYRSDACGRMYEIANFWLSDLREEIKQEQERLRGERTVVIPAMFHVSKDKPFLDAEGHALKYLEELHYADPTGPYADKSLWLLGYVNFYRQNYRDADLYLSQLVEHYPESKLRAHATELAIMAKNNATGGPAYDGKKSAEAIKLIHAARSSMPEFSGDRGEFLDRQLATISLQQAMKDYDTAEFYRRTGHPGSAYFCYETVRRRYPNTRFAELASARMAEMQKLVDAGISAPNEAPAIAKPSGPVAGFINGLFEDQPEAPEQSEGRDFEDSGQLPAPRRLPPTDPSPNSRSIPQEYLPR